MGDVEEGNNEDYSIVMGEDKRSAIEARDKNNLWGFKDPNGIEYLENVLDLLSNPRIIVAFRDLLAIAKSRHKLSGIDVNDALAHSLNLYFEIWGFISTTQIPVLGISYERALRDPRKYIVELASFCNIEPSVEQFKRCLYLVQPDCGAIHIGRMLEQEESDNLYENVDAS